MSEAVFSHCRFWIHAKSSLELSAARQVFRRHNKEQKEKLRRWEVEEEEQCRKDWVCGSHHIFTPDELAAVLFPVQISVYLLQNLTSVFSSFRLMFLLMQTGVEDYSLRFFLSTHASSLSHYLTISCTHTYTHIYTHTDAPASRASTYNRTNKFWQEHTVDRGPESLSARCRCSSISSAVS